jgi:cytochrome c
MMTRYLLIAAFAWIVIAQDNHAPVVKIQSPVSNTTIAATTQVRYEIIVSDKEDGDSRYDEINPKEVILEVRLGTTHSTPLEAPGLAVMARSNCFNCHQFNAKGIGPSLADIAKRYPAATATTDTLLKRIKDGSTGIWGKEKMPSHPELNVGDIRQMVQWIQKYAATSGVAFQNGTTGVLQFPAATSSGGAATPKPGIYTLTAAYTDHGIKDSKDISGHYLTGLDHITVNIK